MLAVANVNALYSHRVLRVDTSTEVIPSSTAKELPAQTARRDVRELIEPHLKNQIWAPLGGLVFAI